MSSPLGATTFATYVAGWLQVLARSCELGFLFEGEGLATGTRLFGPSDGQSVAAMISTSILS